MFVALSAARRQSSRRSPPSEAQPTRPHRRLAGALRAKLISGLLVLPVFGLSALAWQQYAELVSLRARTIDGDERVALNQTMAELQRRNRELEALLRATRLSRQDAKDMAANARADAQDASKSASAVLAALAADDPATAAESRRDAELELLGAMADIPEFQRLIALQQRAKIDAKYAALVKKLNLTPEQAQKFENLLADRQSAFADAMIAAHDQGLSGKEARDMAQAVTRATQKDIDSNIKSLLGPQGYGQFQNYEQTMPQRETVMQLAQRLSYTATPLSTRQQDQLVQLLATTANQAAAAAAAAASAASGQKVPRPATTLAPLPGALSSLGIASSSTALITAGAVAKAQGLLAAQQLNALRQMQQEQQAQLTLSKLLQPAKPTVVKRPGNG
jgi:hypothetical protein